MLIKTNTDSKKFQAIALLGICLLTVCAFLPTFWNGFQMEWDDHWMVMNPLTKGHMDFDLVKSIFTTSFHGQWGPINQLAYTTIYSLVRYSSWAYHIYSLTLHLANICLVSVIIKVIFTDCSNLSATCVRRICIITTALFAIHPLQVETVAWISASKILLSSFFYLTAVYTLLLFFRNRSKWFYFAVLILYACSYLSKENVLMFPLLTMMLCVMYKSTVWSRRFWIINTPIFILTIIFGLHLVFHVSGYSAVVPMETFNIGQRIILCSYTLIMYIYKWLFPIGLNWMYLSPTQPGGALPYWMAFCPMLLALTGIALWDWIKKSIIAFSLIFFILHLLFVIHLLFLPRSAIIAERYMYLPIIGLNVIFSYFISLFMNSKKGNFACKTGLTIILFSCFFLSFYRTGQWHDSKTLRENDIYTPATNEPDISTVNNIL